MKNSGLKTGEKAIKFTIVTPRGTFQIHTIFSSLEEAREDGWGLWFQHENYLILTRDNRIGSVVDLSNK